MSTAIYDAKMTLENSGFNAAMNKARETSNKALETIKAVGLGVTGLGGAFAAFKGADAFAEGIRGAIESGRQLTVQARQASQSVATMVELRRAFQDAGLSADSVGTALFMLNKAMGGVNEEGQPTATAFNRIGLSLADLKKMDATGQFRAIIQGLSGLPDASSRANAAQQIFGRGARDVMAILNDPKGFNQAIAGSQSYAQTMQKNSAAFEQVDKAVEQVQMKIQEFYAGVAVGLAPLLEKVLALVNKIDLGKLGANIGTGIAAAFEIFKSGKIFDLIRLGVVGAFKAAINVMVGGIYGLAGAMQAEFRHVPELLRDAFGMLTNPKFWKGIGELLLGAFMSIQGRLMLLFVGIADALGNRLADILDHIPLLKGGAEKLREMLNAGTGVAATALGKMAGQGDAMLGQGGADITGATGKIAGDYLGMIKDEIGNAMAAYQQHSNSLENPELRQAAAIIKDVWNKVSAAQANQASEAAPAAGPANNTMTGVNLKTVDSDRLAKVGLFIGGSVSAPGLSEARRTATATERTARGIDNLLRAAGTHHPMEAVYG